MCCFVSLEAFVGRSKADYRKDGSHAFVGCTGLPLPWLLVWPLLDCSGSFRENLRRELKEMICGSLVVFF